MNQMRMCRGVGRVAFKSVTVTFLSLIVLKLVDFTYFVEGRHYAIKK